MDEQEPHVLGELSKYLNGQLSGAERRRVEAHLESCEPCHRHNEGLLSLRNLIQQTPSLMPAESVFKKLIPSGPLLKILVWLGVLGLAGWGIRKAWPHRDWVAQKTPAKPVVVVSEARHTAVQTTPPPAVQAEDPGVQDLQQLANTPPAAATAPVETALPTPAPAVTPGTAPAISSPTAP